VHRLETEFGAPVELSPTAYTVARVTDEDSSAALRGMRGVTVLERADGTRLALFESKFWLDRVIAEQPDLRLDALVGNSLAG
jgi:peptide chain release factor 3